MNKCEYAYKKVVADIYETESIIKVVYTFTDKKGESHTDNPDTYNLSEFIDNMLPVIKIVKGVDDISNALIYTKYKQMGPVMVRFLKEGTKWIKIKGIRFKKDGTFKIRRKVTNERTD
jgi:hypothetical protein